MYAQRSRVLNACGRPDDALNLVAAAKAFAANDPEFLLIAAEACVFIGEEKQARVLLRRAKTQVNLRKTKENEMATDFYLRHKATPISELFTEKFKRDHPRFFCSSA